jgi:hypothetical protein
MHELFSTLSARKRPEDVAQMILETLGPRLGAVERATLDKAARHSLKRGILQWTSMAEKFHAAVPPARQVAKALELFRSSETWAATDFSDADKIAQLISRLSPLIRKQPGQNDFKSNRLNTAQREEAGLDLSRRRYNKLFRMLVRLERKLDTYVHEQRKELFTKVGKTRLAAQLPREEFERDAGTAAFVAYFTARSGMRSVFTNEKQAGAYDEICGALFTALLASPTTNWWAVAHVMPDRRVVARLGAEQRGLLLGRWMSLLNDIADLLRETWEASNIERDTMIVRRGNDSSTWNATAGAWNKARAAWITLMHELGLEAELDRFCPGKVLRLMAADVAAWHRVSGGKLEPDTQVWNELPLPWQVLNGTAVCTREQVEAVCAKHQIDPVKKGWIAPPPEGRPVEPYQVTPELVHGVAISCPHLATVLRKAGWFSGKESVWVPVLAEPVRVVRDVHGFANGVSERSERP